MRATSTFSCARLTSSCSLDARPTPRAAVVARPRVVALNVLRPKSAPRTVAPIEMPSGPSRRTPVPARATRPAPPCAASPPALRALVGKLAPHGIDLGVARFALRRLRADPEVPLRLSGLRGQLQIRVAIQVERLRSRDPRGERLLPRGVALRGGRRLRDRFERRAVGRRRLQRGRRDVEDLRLPPIDGHRAGADRRDGDDIARLVDLQLGVRERHVRNPERHRRVVRVRRGRRQEELLHARGENRRRARRVLRGPRA